MFINKILKFIFVIIIIITIGCSKDATENSEDTTSSPSAVGGRAISKISPENGEANVDLLSTIKITFSKTVKNYVSGNQKTNNCLGNIQISENNFQTCVPIDEPSSSDKLTYTITLKENLTRGSIYKIRIFDFDYNPQTNEGTQVFSSSFTTIENPEIPTITEVSTLKDTDNRTRPSSYFKITFSEGMDTSTLTTNVGTTSCSGSIQLSNDNFITCVAMIEEPEFSNSNKSVKLYPTSVLSSNQIYKLKFKDTIQDTTAQVLTETTMNIEVGYEGDSNNSNTANSLSGGGQPGVGNVSSISGDTFNNSAWTTGQTLSFKLSYNLAVTVNNGVTGSGGINPNCAPRVLMQTNNGNDKYACYSAKLDASSLQFTYTIQSGDYSTDLCYANSTAMELNGATIVATDNSSISAQTQLTNPGEENSLCDNSNISIDATSGQQLKVSQVTGTNPDKGYHATGDLLSINAIFARTAVWTGDGFNPRMRLNLPNENGNTFVYADYVSGSGTDTWIFTYTVQDGDYSSDLNYVDLNSLEFTSGTIRDAAGNVYTYNTGNAITDVTLPNSGDGGELKTTSSVVIDGIGGIPTLQSMVGVSPDLESVDSTPYDVGDTVFIKAIFDKPVVIQSGKEGSPRFYLRLNNGYSGEYAYVCRTSLITAGTIPSPPSGSCYDGTATKELMFYYKVKAGDYSADLSDEDFDINNGQYIKNISQTTGAVTTFANNGEPGSLSYNNSIQIDGWSDGSLTVYQVRQTTSTTSTGSNYNKDCRNNKNGSDVACIPWTSGDTLNFYMEFTKWVTVSGSPRLKIQTYNGNRYAYYSYTDRNRIYFSFPLIDGDYSDDLGYTDTTALELNGGTITGNKGGTTSVPISDGVSTDLTLPSPGGSRSLSSGESIKVDALNSYAGPLVTYMEVWKETHSTNSFSTSGGNADTLLLSTDTTAVNSTDNVSLSTGDVLYFRVFFNPRIDFNNLGTDDVQLALDMGTTKYAVCTNCDWYVGNANDIYLSYTIQSNDYKCGLDYVDPSSLFLVSSSATARGDEGGSYNGVDALFTLPGIGKSVSNVIGSQYASISYFTRKLNVNCQ